MNREPREWLVAVRRARKLSQQDLAGQAAISRNYLSEIESGTKKPSVPVAMRLAEILDVDWTVFFGPNSRETQHTA